MCEAYVRGHFEKAIPARHFIFHNLTLLVLAIQNNVFGEQRFIHVLTIVIHTGFTNCFRAAWFVAGKTEKLERFPFVIVSVRSS